MKMMNRNYSICCLIMCYTNRRRETRNMFYGLVENSVVVDKPLTDFVDTYLKNWGGFMEESVFEVNMLSIDEKTILSFNKQKEVHDKLRQHGIEPIYCKFRHRHFWDAGLHCLTLDTVREGGCETYL